MRRLLLALALLALVPAAAAAQESAPDEGKPFEPRPLSQPVFTQGSPTVQHNVTASDGTALFVETWLPAKLEDGPAVPDRIPTILIATPYVKKGVERYPTRNLEPVIAYFNARGYAVAQHHVRGTGASGGCLEQTARLQIDDVARVIQYLGRDAAWSNGNVGMYGHSYDAETQVSTAGRGDRDMVKYLKAIVPSATVGGQYEWSFMDGVPLVGQGPAGNASYLAASYQGTDGVEHYARRGDCQGEIFANALNPTGDMSPYWRQREYRPEADSIDAATLWVHGLADRNVQAITVSGFFDRLPASTPKAGLFGQWEHNYPDKHAGVAATWARLDFLPTVTAWYDRFLKNLDVGVESWPTVQVQGTDGQWRAEAGYPQTGGPVGQLALGPNGALGATAPTGSTAFREGANDANTVPGTRAVFETPAVSTPLHITGMPIADLWLQTDRPDGHVSGKLEIIAPDGARETLPGSSAIAGTYGARSLMHLDPMPRGFFQQEEGRPAPILTPIRVPLRFQPIDFVVGAGSKLRLTIAGTTTFVAGPGVLKQTQPSGAAGEITLFHDCQRTSALRFLTARPDGPLLDVRETDEPEGPLKGGPTPERGVDGGGLASAAVCGRAPERPAAFGAVRKP